jgi:hypothetical protein
LRAAFERAGAERRVRVPELDVGHGPGIGRLARGEQWLATHEGPATEVTGPRFRARPAQDCCALRAGAP